MNRVIAITLVTVAGFLSTGAQAAPVTIDFEEFNIGDGGGSVLDDPVPILASQGYEFTGSGGPGGPFTSTEVITGTNTGGTNAYGGSISGLGQDGFNVFVSVTFEKADGGAFAIHNLDLFMDTDPDGWTEISGTRAGGGLTFLSGVAVGTGDWLNLESVTFRAEGNGFGPGGGAIQLDNIAVSAVPVPAAVWLFGSALAGLGWLRRKQTV
jgi:hypothetical protein